MYILWWMESNQLMDWSLTNHLSFFRLILLWYKWMFCYDESISQKHKEHIYLLSYDFLVMQTPETFQNCDLGLNNIWTQFVDNVEIWYFLFARRCCNEIFSIASAPSCAQFRHLSKRIGSNCCTVCNSINKETIWSAPRALLNHITLSYNFERNIYTTKIYRILNLYLKMGSQFHPF